MNLLPFILALTMSAVLLGAWMVERRRRRKAERDRDEAAREASLIRAATNDAVWDYDLKADTVQWSGTLLAMFGYKQADIESGLDWWDSRIHTDDRERVVTGLRESIQRAEPSWTDTYRFRRADGSYAHVRDQGWVIVEDGKPARMVGTIIDMTEHEHAAASLRQSQERFAAFMDNTPVGAWIKDRHGRYIYVNNTLMRQYRAEPQEVLGKTDHELFDAGVAAELRRNDEAALAAGAPIEITETIPNPDGTDHIWLISKFPLRDPTGEQLVGGMAMDITEQKRAEESVSRHAAELRSINETQRLLLNELDHRVRNNLAALLSLIGMCRERYDGSTPFADAVRSRVEAMAVVHHTLSGARWEPVSLSKLVLAIAPPEAVHCLQLVGDPVVVPARQVMALGMVVHELLANSIKHGALHVPDGRVRLEWTLERQEHSRLHVSWRESGGPPPQDPQPPRGMGTSLINGLMRSELRGRANLSYPPDGARHELLITLDDAPTNEENETTPPAARPGATC